MGTLPAEPMTSRGHWMGRVGAGPAWSCSKGLEESAKRQRRQGSHSAERQNRGLGPGQSEAGSWRGVWAKPTSPRWRSAWVGQGVGGRPVADATSRLSFPLQKLGSIETTIGGLGCTCRLWSPFSCKWRAHGQALIARWERPERFQLILLAGGWQHLPGRRKNFYTPLELPPRGPDWPGRLSEPVTGAPPVSTDSGLPDTCSAPGVAMGTSRGASVGTPVCLCSQGPWTPLRNPHKAVHTDRSAGVYSVHIHMCARVHMQLLTHTQLCALTWEGGPTHQCTSTPGVTCGSARPLLGRDHCPLRCMSGGSQRLLSLSPLIPRC